MLFDELMNEFDELMKKAYYAIWWKNCSAFVRLYLHLNKYGVENSIDKMMQWQKPIQLTQIHPQKSETRGAFTSLSKASLLRVQ